MKRGVLIAVAAAIATGVLVADPAASQAPAQATAQLPVKTYKKITTFRGSNQVVASGGGAVYTLYSAQKEGGRPWAGAVFVKRQGGKATYLSRAYDCSTATYRWLGEYSRPDQISLSVTSLNQTRRRALQPGTIEYQLAYYACAL